VIIVNINLVLLGCRKLDYLFSRRPVAIANLIAVCIASMFVVYLCLSDAALPPR
jgi:hypothetical protein